MNPWMRSKRCLGRWRLRRCLSVRQPDLSGLSKCPGWTCCDVLNHSIAVTLRIARFASGESDRPELPQGDLIGSDPADSLRAAVITAQRAWALTDRTRVCHLSFGDFEAETAAGINLVDVLAHGWDISPLQGRWFECGNETWSVAPGVLIGPNSRSAPLWTRVGGWTRCEQPGADFGLSRAPVGTSPVRCRLGGTLSGDRVDICLLPQTA